MRDFGASDDTLVVQRQIDRLRERLIDLTNRNRMLNLPHREGARTQLRIVDAPLDGTWQRLVVDEGGLELLALPPPPDEPADEGAPTFLLTLERLRRDDPEWQRTVQSDPDLSTAATRRLDRTLRDRVRAELGLKLFVPGRLPSSLADHARAHGIDPSFELAIRGEKPRGLRTLLLPEPLEARADAVARQARSAEQETGASTLYAAFGFLEWFEAPDSDRTLHAPLILLPTMIEKVKRGTRKIYEVSAGGDEPATNTSLERRLERDFGLALPAFDPKAVDPIAGYLDTVGAAVRGRRGWRVRSWLTLAHLSFAKLAMWRDLDPSSWPADRQPAAKALVREVLRGPAVAGDGLGLPDEHDIDDPAVEASAPVLIHDADSSQHSAIIDVMRGKNLVVEGPPGTGKSQTIANLIANAIHAGQKVLFVAEKQAALTVVKARLDAAGLGDFCLELHSAKTKPKEVVASLKARAEMRGRSSQPGAASNLAATRDRLNAYDRALHQPRTARRASAFELFWRERAAADALDAATHASIASVELPDAAVWDEVQLAERRRLVRELAGAASAWATRAMPARPRPLRRSGWTTSILCSAGRRSSGLRDASPIWSAGYPGTRAGCRCRKVIGFPWASSQPWPASSPDYPRLPTRAEALPLDELLVRGFETRLSEAAQRMEMIGDLDRLLATPPPPRLDPEAVERVRWTGMRRRRTFCPPGRHEAQPIRSLRPHSSASAK
jgi:hypothetical protein